MVVLWSILCMIHTRHTKHYAPYSHCAVQRSPTYLLDELSLIHIYPLICNHIHSYMMKEAFFTIISIHIRWKRHSSQLYPFIHDEGGILSLYPICAHHAQLDLLDINVRTRAKKIPLKLIADYKARNMRMENTSRQNYLHFMKIVFTTLTCKLIKLIKIILVCHFGNSCLTLLQTILWSVFGINNVAPHRTPNHTNMNRNKSPRQSNILLYNFIISVTMSVMLFSDFTNFDISILLSSCTDEICCKTIIHIVITIHITITLSTGQHDCIFLVMYLTWRPSH